MSSHHQHAYYYQQPSAYQHSGYQHAGYQQSHYQQPTYQPSASMPISMPQKQGYNSGYSGYYAGYPHSRISMSPPEAPESVTTSGVPSYEPSATSSSYAGSASDYDTSTGTTTGVDLLEYMGDRLHGSLDPIPLDRSLAKQAQVSGQLNAKTQELLELQRLAQSRLSAMKMDFSDGMKAAKEVQRDLQWTQKRVASINERAARKYPEQYKVASQRYPRPVDY